MENIDTHSAAEPYPDMYKGGYFDDDDIVPEVELEQGIDLTSLREHGHTEFSIDGSNIPIECDDLGEYHTEEMHHYLSPDVGAGGDWSDVDEESEESPFEQRAKRMIDVTPAKDGGVLKKVQKEGIGRVIAAESFVTVNYNAYLEYQDEPADSTYLRGRPLRFPLGQGRVVAGLDVAVSTMRVNETSCFLFKPDYYLGKGGCPPRIPPDSTVMFHVELKAAEETGGADEYYSLTASEKREAPFSLVKQVAMREKQEGNSHYTGERYVIAARCYSKAIRILENCRLKDDEEERIQQKLLFQIYRNVGLSFNKLQKAKPCLTNINKALQIDRNDAKCRYIKGKALRMLGDLQRAKSELVRAKQLNNTDKSIAQELILVDSLLRKNEVAEKAIYRNMFSGNPIGDETEEAERPVHKRDHTRVDESFLEKVTEKLRKFQLDSSMSTLSLPPELSMAEIDCIMTVCHDIGLEMETKGTDSNIHHVITRPKVNELN